MIVMNKSYIPKIVGGNLYKNSLRKVSSNIDDIIRNTQKLNMKGGSLISDNAKTQVRRNPIKFL